MDATTARPIKVLTGSRYCDELNVILIRTGYHCHAALLSIHEKLVPSRPRILDFEINGNVILLAFLFEIQVQRHVRLHSVSLVLILPFAGNDLDLCSGFVVKTYFDKPS